MRPKYKFLAHEPGAPYRPSNGDEGLAFDSMHCEYCRRDQAFRGNTAFGGCEILARTMAFTLNEPGYPKEWIYGQDGQPKCTAFDDIEREPNDPNQMELTL